MGRKKPYTVTGKFHRWDCNEVCLDCGKWSGVVLAGSADCVLNSSGEVFKDLADRYAAFPILLVALQKISKEKDSEGMVSRAASIAIEALDKTGN